jgi:hypothetical protein
LQTHLYVLLCSSIVLFSKSLNFDFVRSNWQKKMNVQLFQWKTLIIQFTMLFLNVYGNLSISSTSPFKFVAFSYLHADVIDIVGTIIITVSIIKVWSNTCWIHKQRFFFTSRKFICENQNRLWQKRFWLDNWTFHNHKSDNHSIIWSSCEVAFFVKRPNS